MCEHRVLDGKINEHLDSNCSSMHTNGTKHGVPPANKPSNANISKGITMTRDGTRNSSNNTKLAPIFSLGKRGPETRPTASQDDVEMLATFPCSQAQPIDIDEAPPPPAKRARQTEGEPSSNKRQIVSMFAPKRPSVQAPPGGYLKA